MRLEEAEVQAGLVVHLDTGILRALADSQTNAEVGSSGDRAVVGPHYFLVVDVQAGQCIAVPLFSNYAPGSEQLSEALKRGPSDKWVGITSYFSRWQHWRIPTASLVASSDSDEGQVGSRRRYAASATELAQMRDWQNKNRAPYRSPN